MSELISGQYGFIIGTIYYNRSSIEPLLDTGLHSIIFELHDNVVDRSVNTSFWLHSSLQIHTNIVGEVKIGGKKVRIIIFKRENRGFER